MAKYRKFKSRRRSNMPYVFGATPTVRMPRSQFDLSHGLKTSMSVGKLYPVEILEVLPGDTFKMHTSQVCRLSTAFHRPVMDNAFMDVYYFFVPHRIAYDKFVNVFGENTESAWANTEEYEIPSFPTTQTVTSKSVADYLGLPVGSIPGGCQVLPFREFAMIYDQWFRNENTVPPMHIQKGEFNDSETINSNAWSPANYTGMLPNVGKKKDYFTSCLPSPQKGDAVHVSPISSPWIPVVPRLEDHDLDGSGIRWRIQNSLPQSGAHYPYLLWASQGSQAGTPLIGQLNSSPSTSNAGNYTAIPSNLWADTSSLEVTNVNDLRMAFQIQRMLEKDARYGTRYREFLLGHFSVSNPDARMQIPEFLGGSRMPLNVQQVAQTNSQQSAPEMEIDSPLAALGAFSQSGGKSRFTKSFTEHGYVFVVACIRTMHTYQQGIDKHWFRKTRNDHYDPLFANLGEQPVYRSQIFAQGEMELEDNVFGYQEAWADYRYRPSHITGQMRSGVTDSFDVWHFGDYYANAPVLGQEFTDETSDFFDRTVAASSDDVDNFLVDFWFDTSAVRVMPKYSVPGLIDHH